MLLDQDTCMPKPNTLSSYAGDNGIFTGLFRIIFQATGNLRSTSHSLAISAAFVFIFLSSGYAQTLGDYRSNAANFNWSVRTSWQRFNGATWAVPSTLEGYPGQIAAGLTATVTIQNGHVVTLDASPALSIVNLVVGGGTSGTLNFGNNGTSRTLTVTGALTVNAGGTFQNGSTATAHNLNLGGDLINNGTFNFDNGGGAAGGTVTFTGLGTQLIRGTSASTTMRGLSVTAGTVRFGDNANARSLNVTATFTVAALTTFQSGSTGAIAHDINFTGTLTNNGTIDLTANAATNQSLDLTGATSVLGSAAATTTLYYLNIQSGTTTWGTNANARTITVTKDIVVSAGATFQSGNTGAAVHTLNIGRTLSNNGTFNLAVNTPTAQTVVFTDSTGVSGSGTTTFCNVTMNTGGDSLRVNKTITINNQLNFAANGVMIVSSSSNIRLAATAPAITGFNASRYIMLDGDTGTDSQLIKLNSGDDAQWEMSFPIGTYDGGYNPVVITTVANTPDPTNGSSLSVKAIYNNSIQGQLRRTFRLIVAGNAAATTFSAATFNYDQTADVSAGDSETNYTTVWYLNSASATASWSSIGGTVTTASDTFAPTLSAPQNSLADGTYYFTLGTSTAYPNTWYSYQTGVWSDWQNWTLDPSGTTLVNGLNLPPQAGDEIVILNGITITNDISGQVVASNTIIQGGGTLDLSNTTANTLGPVSGSGTLRIEGVTLPTGNFTSFVSTLGGTFEFYNTGGTFPNGPLVSGTPTFNNLKLTNSSASDIVFAQVGNLTVNGTFDLSTTGTGTVGWQINDVSNAQRTIILNGDLNVGAGGRISVGGSNANDNLGNENTTTPHSLTMYGNFTNNGIVKFFFADTELPEADYGLTYPAPGQNIHRNELQGNAVTVTFSGVDSKTVTCNNKTDFYRLVLNKGTGQQAVLTINSSDVANFRLFGPADLPTDESLGAANSHLYISANALSIINGTLQLTGNIDIPVLQIDGSTAGYFPIPRNGTLWLNGPNVTVQISDLTPDIFSGTKDGRILISGLLRVSQGTLKDGFSKGLGSQDGGSYLQEGGTVSCWQFRPRSVTGNPPFSFTQTGGTLNVGYGYATSGGKIDQFEEDYARFDLRSPNSTFQMSGNAVLNVAKPTSNADAGVDGGLFLIASTSSNYNVTGGTVNLYTGVERSTAESYPGFINSTAPFYNLNIYEESATTQTTQLQTNDLIVLNNLTINTGNTPSFVTNSLDVTVGGNFIINGSTTFTPGTGTVTFNGSGAQAWTNDGTITSPLTSVVVAKTAGSTLTLGGTTHTSFLNAAGTGTITGLTLTSGTLADNGKILTVTGTLNNSAIHSGAGQIIANGPTTIGGANGTFGNLTIQTSADVTTNGDQTVTGNLRLTGGTSSLNIADYNLTVLGGLFSDGTTGTAFSADKQIFTNGLHNAGGLTRQASDALDLIFPIGSSSTLYTPNIINVDVTNVTGVTGRITVRPVNGTHPNVTTTAQSVRYYWRVTSTGFSQITAVNHMTYTYSTAARDAAGANYRAARYDPLNYTWGYSTAVYNSTAGNGTSIIAVNASPFAFNTATAWNNVTGTQLDGEYTAGNLAAFGSVKVFYSRTGVGTPGAWNQSTTWSNIAVGGTAVTPAGSTTAGTHFPGPNNPVVIGNATNDHGVTIDNNSRNCGSLQIASGSVLDCSTFTGLNFGANTAVTGNGTIRIAATGSPAPFPGGDFTNFVGPTGGTVEWYGTAKTLPTVPDTYYNLVINASAGAITLPNTDLRIYGTLTKSGANNSLTTVTAARTITIDGDFNISAGQFVWQNTTVTNLNIAGTTTVSSGAALNLTGTGALSHTFTTKGDVVNNGTITFRNTNHVVNTVFTGTADRSFSGTGATSFNLVTLDKGTSQTPTLVISVSGTTTSLPTGWLTLLNGTIDFANSASYSLNTASSAYTIPATTKLKVSSGTVDVIGNVNSDAGDLLLGGTLEVTGTGSVNINPVGNNRNSNNDIEYASAGSPSITVSGGGSLYVNGAIRRPTTTLYGSLVYAQSGGTTTVGGRNSDANNTRGVFEIENNLGSSFTMSGGTLNIRRSTGGTAFADLYLNPVTSSISSPGTITMGMDAATLALNPLSITATLSMNVTPVIGNFSILNVGSAQNVNMRSSNLSAGGTITISANSTLTTAGLNVNVGGDLMITGTYVGGIAGNLNVTTFNGAGPQTGTLSGTSSFNNMTVDKPSGTVELAGSAPSLNDLNILNGVLDVKTLGLKVAGNITNNSSQISTTESGSVIISGTGASHTINSSGGSFHNLTLNDPLVPVASKTITVNGNMTINGVLDFTNTASITRYFFIRENLLIFSSTGTVNNSGTASNSIKFIKTNGVSSDLGVVKNFPASTTTTFTYAVGTRINYTPVTVNLTTTAGGAGALNVIPVDNQHPTASATGEQILNYYWIVKRDNSLAYSNTGSHVYQFPTGLLGGAAGTIRGAHLDAINLIGWTQPVGTLNTVAPNTTLTITNSLNTNLPLANGEFHYTVGTANTLPTPITPVYSRISDNGGANPSSVSVLATGGNWNLATNWTLESDGTGTGLSAIPAGRPVVILPGHRINMNVSGLSAFTTQINGLVVATTAGHNLGTISGTGILRTTTSTLPAGTYTNFVAASGGTIEYDYTGNVAMNSRNTYNNLSIRAGTAQMTNTDLTLNGSLTVAAGAILDNTTNNRSVSIMGNWTNNGTFNAGTGAVSFNGTTGQSLNGSTTFNSLTVNKTGNLTLSGTATTTVNAALTLSAGNVIASSTHPLTFAASTVVSGGSTTSFVQGPMIRPIAAGGTFIFPAGSTVNSNYRPATVSTTSDVGTWTVEYVGRNPTTDGYNNTAMNAANLGTVSRFEYWNVSRTGAASATLTFPYDVSSYISPNVGVVANLRVARWTGAQWDLPPGGGVHTPTGTITAGTVSVTLVNSFSPFTFGSTDLNSPLPVKWLSFTGVRSGSNVILNWNTAQELNNRHFEIERMDDGAPFVKIGTKLSWGDNQLPQHYEYIDQTATEFKRYYYRIRQVDLNGKSDYSNVVVVSYTDEPGQHWNVFPNPVEEDNAISLQSNKTDYDQVIELVVRNAPGQVILTQKGTLSQLNDYLNRSSANLRSGVYLIQLNDGSYSEYFRVVKL